jgi:hypothetical protein
MGVITEQDRALAGYETVQIPGVSQQAGSQGTAMLRRRSGRTAKRAVLYVHCLADTFVPDDLASWYTERGFHFYVADLRPPGAGEAGESQDPAAQRVPGLDGSITALDAMASHLRDAEGIDTLVVGAHASGAAIAAVWCDARRDASPADAVVLAGPALAAGRGRAARRDGLPPGSRRVLAEAAEQLDAGLDIACPVLVLCTEADDDPDQLGRRARRAGRRGHPVVTRLGPHVTWLRLDGELTGPLPPAGPESRPFFRELGRWLGAYLSGQFRDQLL